MYSGIQRRALCVAVSFSAIAGAGFAQTWSTLPSRTNDTPGFAFTPSPTDWRDINIYQVMTDRFYDGDPANNDDNPDADTNPYGTVSVHGGDFEGLEQKLDYLQMLGAKAVWISPVVKNVRGSFHGYAATDFNMIDPHWGTLEDLRNFIDAAHARGIYVIIDVVQNHLGDLADSTDFGFPSFNINGYNLRWRNSNRRHAPPFDDLSRLHNYGNVQNWDDATQSILGDFSGLDGIRTEDQQVRDDLVRIYKGLIEATDCDGFRVDTARHIEMDFWEYFLPAIEDHASSLGKTNFLSYAEAWRGLDSEVGAFTGTNRFPSALYFPMLNTMENVFIRGQNTSQISDRHGWLSDYDPEARHQLIMFLDNHDMSRALAADKLNGNQTRLYPALTFLYTHLQVPCLYYGTEQGFDGGNDPYDREDMFDGEFEYGPSLGDNFDMTHPLYRHVRTLNLLREAYPELRRGVFQERWQDFAGSGLYVYERILDTNGVLVALNTASGSREAIYNGSGPAVIHSNGTVLVNIFNTNDTLTVGSGGGPGLVALTLGGYESRIYIPSDRLIALAPSVISISPRHDTTGVDRASSIVIEFDRSMETGSVEAAFSMEPETAGVFSWFNENTRMVFNPDALLPQNTRCRIVIGATATSADAVELGAAFESFFDTGTGTGGLHPLGSFVLDGVLDEGVPQIAHNNGISLYAAYDATNKALYVATVDAGEGNDHFIFLDDEQAVAGVEVELWNKNGTIALDGPFLADENDNDFVSWYRTRASANAKTGPNGGVLEGVINLEEQYGTVPESIWMAVGIYGSADGGSILPTHQVPPSQDLDINIDSNECLRFYPATGAVVFETSGGNQQEVPLKTYVLDGILSDAEAATVRATNVLHLYADFNGKLLYVATEDAGEGNDHFIFVTDDPDPDLSAPWAKSGRVFGRLHFLADENDSDFEGWFINNAMDLSHPAATPFNNGGYLEGAIDLVQVFGRIPSNLYLSVASYATADGGGLNGAYQVPLGNGDGDLESLEYFQLRLDTFDTDGDGIPDLAEDLNANGIADAGETGARIPDSDGDGQTDGEELAAGHNPLNPADWFGREARSSVNTNDRTFHLEWPGLSNSVYDVMAASGLGTNESWEPTGFMSVTGDGSSMVYVETNTDSSTSRFYRIRWREAE